MVETNQLGVLSPGAPAGSPDMVTTVSTPILPARTMVSRMVLECILPIGVSMRGLPEQLSAEMARPLFVISARNASRFASSLMSSSAEGMKLQPPQPPAVISIASRPYATTLSSISVKGIFPKTSVQIESFIILFSFGGGFGGMGEEGDRGVSPPQTHTSPVSLLSPPGSYKNLDVGFCHAGSVF